LIAKTTYQTDLLILGGGIAGFGAVLGAAEQGLDIVLLERNTFLGGAATAAYVSTVCGLFYRSEDGPPQYVMQGPTQSFGRELARMSETEPVKFSQGLWFLPYARHAFMELADLGVQRNARVFLQATVHDVQSTADRIEAVVASVSNHPVEIHARAVVDCSGEALIGKMCGHPLIRDTRYQAGAQVFSMSGLQGTDDRTISLQVIKAVKVGIESGDLPEECARLSIVPGSFDKGMANFKLGIPMEITDDIENHTTLQITARALVSTVADYLRKSSPAFRHAEITMIAPSVGIRTGLRYQGVQTLEDTDVLSCQKSHESVARGAWPIELWRVGQNPQMDYFAENDFYDVPAGCLESPVMRNLWFAGRHLSGSEGAIGSVRVIGTAMATGFAAGALAAAQLGGVSRTKRINEIQDVMEGASAIPPAR